MRAAEARETPVDAPILCQIRTGGAAGSWLVGTVHTRLSASLGDVRVLLKSLARRARGDTIGSGCDAGVDVAPVNATSEELQRIMSHPLHPFDLGSAFSFVRHGGCVAVPQRHEGRVRLLDIFPRLPRQWGVSSAAGWAMEPPPPLVRILVRPEEYAPCRDALSVLFISQGEAASLMVEQVVVERHMLQQGAYGRPYQLKELSAILNPWNANVKDCFGRTVLHECVHQCSKEAVTYLLSLPFICANEQDAQGKSPLHIAARGGNEFIVARLLESGADILTADISGDTPLHIALRLRSDRIVELLCKGLRAKGIPMGRLGSCKNRVGLSPIDMFRMYSPSFMQLCEEGDTAGMRSLYRHYLFPRESINEHDGYLQQSAVHVAAAGGHIDALKLLMDDMGFGRLLESNSSINLLNSRLQTPLHVAVEGGHLAVVRLLHERFPHWVSMQDITGATPLVAALRMRRRHVTVVEYLLSSSSCGAVAPDACDNSGMGALHFLCELGMTRAASALITYHGANVGLSHTGGDAAVARRFLAKTRRLPRLERRVKKKTSQAENGAEPPGVTPLICAIRGRRSSVGTVEMLLSHGAGKHEAEVIELLFYLVTGEHYELADRVVAAGMTNTIRHNELLNRFCRLKHGVGIRWCTERGCCSLNSPAGGGYPLTLSAALGDAEAVSFFLSRGADPNAPAGDTGPLLSAISGGHDRVVERLVRAGARLTAVDGSWSALRTAAAKSAESIVRAILGLQSLPPTEVLLALVHAMENFHEPNRAACEQVCVHLARFLDLTATGDIHPTELIHLAASRSLFTVVRALADRLLALPTSTLREILNSTPPPPRRSFVLIEPTTVPLKVKARRLVTRKGRRGLYTPPLPFKRLVVRTRDKDVLFHRLRLRDAFSFCAEANQVALLECLLFDVGLRPWTEADHRGWNAADYAAAGSIYNALRMLIVGGLAPFCRHKMRCSTPLRALCRAMTGVSTNHNDGGLLSSVVCNLAISKETALVRQILLDACRYYDVTDLNGAGAWLDELFLCCVRSGCLELLSLLKEEFGVTLSGRVNLSPPPPLLLLAVARREVEMVSYLLRHGAPIGVTGKIPATGACVQHSLRREKRKVSPLWLAARLGDTAVVELLLSTGPLRPDTCSDTTELCCDALRALVEGVPHNASEPHDLLVARTVNMMARAGHVCLSPRIVRDAAKKGLVQTVVSLVDCYGPRIIIEDIIDDEICSLHYLVSRRTLCGLLRSLLVPDSELEPDEMGGASRNLAWKILSTAFKINPVDYALRAGCTEGALLLVALGMCGSGEHEKGRSCRVYRAMRLCTARRVVQGAGYTVLHAAVELQYHDIVKRILSEKATLLGMGDKAIEARQSGDTPSIAALMAFYFDEAHRHLSLARGNVAPVKLSPRDVPYLVFGQSDCEEEYRGVTQHSALSGGLEQAVNWLHGTLPAIFLWHVLSRHQHSFFFESGSFVMTKLTPMGFAVAAGNLPWVRQLTYSGVSTVNGDSVVARRHRAPPPSRVKLTMAPLQKKTKVRAVKRHHVCDKGNACSIALTDERYHISPLMLSMAIIVESAQSGDTERLLQQLEIMRFLLGCDRCLQREEVNPLSIVAAGLMLWDILEAIVEAAMKLADDPTEGRFFVTLTETEVPPIMGRAIGTARHVMHKAARCAPREILILLAKHSQRADIEESCDATGRTVFFHALLHPHQFAFDVLMGLRIPASRSCCRRTGRTPLMVACQRGQLPLVTALLKKTGLNGTDRCGNTALLLAAAAGQLEVVEHLLANGADPSYRNSRDMTAVMVAALAGHDDIAVPLAENFSKMDDFFSQTTTTLHCAAMGGCWRVAASVVKNIEKADPLAGDGEGFTAIYLAHAFGNAHVLRVLLSAALRRGVEPSPSLVVERQIFACSSALPHYGWLKGVLQVGQALLEESQRCSSRQFVVRPGELTYGSSTSFKWFTVPLLRWCVRNNHAVGVRVLGDMNIGDDCGALHEAAKRGYLDVIELLLKLDMSNPNEPDSAGKSPFELAAVNQHVDCALVLLARTKIDVVKLKTPDGKGGESPLRRIAVTGGAEVLVALVEAARQQHQQGGMGWSSVASQLLDALDTPDSTGMTAFECAVAMGNAAGVLRVAQTLQRLAAWSKRNVALTISNSVLLQLPNASPMVRVLLYDVFNVPDVAMCVGFDQKRAGRLKFADVRLLGINALKRDAFCAPEVAGVFTLDHEITVASSLLKRLRFKIRYKPRPLAEKTSDEQVQLIQWLTSSLVLSSYEDWGGDTAIDTVELELVSHRSEEFAELSGGGHLQHSVYVDARRLLTPNLQSEFQFAKRNEVLRLRSEAEDLCRSLTQKMWLLPHPAFSKGRVAVDWGGGGGGGGGGSSSSSVVTMAAAVTRLISDGLARVAVFLDGRLKDCLDGVSAADVASVTAASEGSDVGASILFRYTHNPVRSRHPSVGDGCVILFGDDAIQDVDQALHSALYNRIQADVNLVHVSFIRDAFVAYIQQHVGTRMSGERVNFKLEVEDSALHELPPHLLKAMMTDAAEAVASLISDSTTGMRALHSSRIVADYIARSFRLVVVLFSSKRTPVAEYLEGKLMLCLNRQLAPTRSDIYGCLRSSAVRDGVERLKAALPRLVADAGHRLNACLPSATLVLDSTSFIEGQDDEFVLSTLSLLCHNQGALVLQPLVEGVSIGWDTRLGVVVRRHVRQITVSLETCGDATCVLYDSGNLVYRCPLHCVERGVHATSSWQFLSSEQIASLLLIQLTAVDSSVPELIDTTKPFACWSQINGLCTKIVNAGSRNCLVQVTTRNILNRRLGHMVGSGLSLVGKWRSVRVSETGGGVRFTAPSRAGYYYQHVLMAGKPLFNSPLLVRVRPRAVHLPRTKVLSKFNTVVVGRPFRVMLRLRDRYGNRIEAPAPIDVDTDSTGAARVIGWKRRRVDLVEVEAVVKELGDKCTVPIQLRTAGEDSFVLHFTVESVSHQTYRQIRLLRGGYALDQAQNNNRSAAALKLSKRVEYFFRRATRVAERRRLARDAKSIGGLASRVFPPSPPPPPPLLPSRLRKR